MVGIGQLGFGQQGARNVEKFHRLKNEGYKIELVYITDTNPEQFKKPVYVEKKGDIEKPIYIKDLFPGVKLYCGPAADAIREYPGVNVVFDSTSTVWEGVDMHSQNMSAFLENAMGRRQVYATEDIPTYFAKNDSYGVEKPVTTSLGLTAPLIRSFKENGISILENAVESFTPTKMASINDIVNNELDILTAEYARISATQEKSEKTGRLIIQNFGGAWYDKMPHDIVKFLQTYGARYGEHYPDAKIDNAAFDTLEIRTPSNKSAYITKKGVFTQNPANPWDLNESYGEAAITMGNTELWFLCSHLGIKPQHLEKIEGWFNEDIKAAVAETSTKNGRPRKPENITAAYGTNYLNMEARVERITCQDKNGNPISYLTQTYGSPVPSFFTAKIDNNGVKVLQEGPSDGHKLFVKNVLDVATGKEKPAIPNDVIIIEQELLERVDRAATREYKEILDLSRKKYASSFAKFLKGPMEKAGCW